jgi:hypothetical protein
MNAEVVQFPAPDVLDNVPVDLRELRGWLLWKLVEGRKIPFYIDGSRRSGEQGSDADRAKLVTFDAARARLKRGGYTGVGLAMLPDYGLTALDFDDCVANGAVHPQVSRMVSGTYAEVSPSGTGVRAFMRGTLAGADKSPEGLAKHGFKFEAYPTKQFVTVTGNAILAPEDELAGATISQLTDAVRWHAALRFAKPVERELSASTGKPHALTADDVREMLEHIADNVDRDRWKDVCFAAERTAQTSKDGVLTHDVVLDLVDAWSRRGNPDSYKGRDDVERKMLEARRRENGYGVGSLWQWAKDGGWQPSAEQVARLHPDGGGAARDEELDDHSESDKPVKPDPLRFLPLSEFANRPFPRWYIKGVLPECDVGMIFGASGSGKSFLCWDIACGLSRGVTEWGGRPARPVKCGWIAAEAVGSVGVRAKAYALHHNVAVDSLDLPVIAAVPDLGDPKQVARIIVGIKERGILLLFIDTLAAVSGGRDENTVEMQVVMNGARTIRNQTGATVIVVHHSGKDTTKGARGSSAIKATCDFELEVERQDEVRNVRVSKMRDGADGDAFAFKLIPVTVGYDDDDEGVTSCAVEHCEPVKRVNAPTLGPVQRIVMDAVQAELGPVPVEDIVTLVADRLVHDPSSGRDNRRRDVLRAINTLAARGVVSKLDGGIVKTPAG